MRNRLYYISMHALSEILRIHSGIILTEEYHLVAHTSEFKIDKLRFIVVTGSFTLLEPEMEEI